MELGAKPNGNIVESESFQNLERRLSEYADYQEMMREQRLARKMLQLWLYFTSAVFMLIFTTGHTLIMRKQTKEA